MIYYYNKDVNQFFRVNTDSKTVISISHLIKVVASFSANDFHLELENNSTEEKFNAAFKASSQYKIYTDI